MARQRIRGCLSEHAFKITASMFPLYTIKEPSPKALSNILSDDVDNAPVRRSSRCKRVCAQADLSCEVESA